MHRADGRAKGHLSSGSLRRRYPEAFRPKPVIYWIDLLASASLGWGGFALGLVLPLGSGWQILAGAIAVLAFYRALLFIHEIAHLHRGAVPGFETAWNLLVGIPWMAPSLMYVGPHAAHHRRSSFGTRNDPEYEPIGHWGRLRIAGSFLTMLFVPALAALRWGLLGPLSRLFPLLRRPVVERASTLVINPAYRRPAPQGRDSVRWALEEAGTALVFWSVTVCLLQGLLRVGVLVQWYAILCAILLLNHTRTLAAHGYENLGNVLDGVGQLLDSATLLGVGPTVLIAPVGLRFHALHHLAPAIPYHSLGRVHRALVTELPPEAPYRATQRPGVLTALWELFSRAAARSKPGIGHRQQA
jgi:fatty acid desaturase